MEYEHFLYPTKMADLFEKSTLESWKSSGKTLIFKKGDFICTPGQLSTTVFLIIEGHARIFHLNPDGKECILGVLSEDDFIDILHVFSDRESQLFSKALTEVKVIAIPKGEIKNVILENGDVAMAFLHYLSNHFQETIEILEQVAYGKVEERLLFLLSKLANKSEINGEWYPLPVFITHKDLAGMIASTRETVTFLINKLIQTGKVKQSHNLIWVKKE